MVLSVRLSRTYIKSKLNFISIIFTHYANLVKGIKLRFNIRRKCIVSWYICLSLSIWKCGFQVEKMVLYSTRLHDREPGYFPTCPCSHSMFKETNGQLQKFDIYARGDSSLQKVHHWNFSGNYGQNLNALLWKLLHRRTSHGIFAGKQGFLWN